MSLNSINTNVAALTAQTNINKATNDSTSSISRLSSGSRIVRAADDVSALASGTSLRTNVTTLRTALINTAQGSSLLQVADGALGQVTDILQRLKSIAVQSGSGSVTDSERAFLNQEFQSLSSEIDRITGNTNFNGVTLLDGSLFEKNDIASQEAVGKKATASITFTQNIASVDSANLILNGVTVTGGTGASVNFARGATLTETLDNAVNYLNGATDTALSGAEYSRQGNTLLITQRAGGTIGETYTIESSIQRSTLLSDTGDATGTSSVASVSGEVGGTAKEQIFFGAALSAGAAIAADTAGLLTAGGTITIDNANGQAVEIFGASAGNSLSTSTTVQEFVDTVNTFSGTTGVRAEIKTNGTNSLYIELTTNQFRDIDLTGTAISNSANFTAANGSFQTETSGARELREDTTVTVANIRSTNLAGGYVSSTGVLDINGNLASFFSGNPNPGAALSLNELLFSLNSTQSTTGVVATLDQVDDDEFRIVLSTNSADTISVLGNVVTGGTNNLDTNTISNLIDIQGADNAGLGFGRTVGRGIVGDSILTTQNQKESELVLQFADLSDANQAANLLNDVISFDTGDGETATDGGGNIVNLATVDFTFVNKADTATLQPTEIRIGATLEDTIDNAVQTLNNYAGTDDYGVKQLEFSREGRNLVIKRIDVGNAVDRQGNALAISTTIASGDGTLSGTSFNNGATGGVTTSGVANKDFIGVIKGFTAEYTGTTDQVNLAITVGNHTYSATNVNTTPTSDTTVRFTSTGGGYFDVQLASGNGTSVSSQGNADTYAARLDAAFSGIEYFQNRSVTNYEAAGDIVTGSAVTGSLTGTAIDIQLGDFSDVTISKISVTAPPEGSNSDASGIIEFVVNGETFRNSSLGQSIGANSNTTFTSLTNPDHFITFTNGSTAIQFDTADKAANFETALEDAFGFNAANSGTSLSFQVGVTTQDTLSLSIGSVTTSKIFDGKSLNVLTADAAAIASDVIDAAIDRVTSVRADVGALQSRFDFAAANVESSIQNQDAARGVLLDTDIAAESTKFATAQVQLQAGIAVLAQANQLPQNLLKLIG
jgi:flagellin